MGPIMALITILGLFGTGVSLLEFEGATKYITGTLCLILSVVAGILTFNYYFVSESPSDGLVLESVIGLDVDIASARLITLGYEVKINFENSSTIDERCVISQYPEPFKVVPRGTIVNLNISLGPNGSYKDQPDDPVYNPPDDPVFNPPDDPVFNPPDDPVSDPPDDPVSDPPDEDYCIVPTLVGLQVDEALSEYYLHNSEIWPFVSSITVHEEWSDNVYCGEIISQSPRAGSKLFYPEEFEIWENKGPQYYVLNFKLQGNDYVKYKYYLPESSEWVYSELPGITTYEIQFDFNIPPKYDKISDMNIMISTSGFGGFSVEEFSTMTWYLSRGLYEVMFFSYEHEEWIHSQQFEITKDEIIYLHFPE